MDEADYICFLAKNISRELYQNGGFVVLPYFLDDPKAVCFPDLNYSKDFWRLISRSKWRNLGDKFPQKTINEINTKLKTINKSKKIVQDGLHIELLETVFGTRGSYYASKNKIYITQRSGNSKNEFERTLLQARLKLENKDIAKIGNVVWHKRQAIAEYVFGKKKSKISFKDIERSNKYLKKLGFTQMDIVNNLDYKNFSTQEMNLLKKLIDKKGNIVSFDDTAQILWAEDSYEKYSLETMAKVIENLRRKIKEQGVMREVIFTKRGRGYFYGS